MPYDLPFARIVELSNEAALELNKSIASKLIADYPEVYDVNYFNENEYFLQQEIVLLDEEFPERHFNLYADIGDIGFSFQFWKDAMWLELGASGDVAVRFAKVHQYAILFEQ